jgi:outer membrane protein assembly factor BamB
VIAIAIAQGLVIAGSRDHRVYALDAASGAERWRFALGGAASALTVTGDLVVVGSDDHRIQALRVRTGAPVWTAGAGQTVTTATLRAAGTSVYAGSYQGEVLALNVQTGAIAWRFATATSYTTPGPAMIGSIADGKVYAGCADRNVYALDARTGAVRWRFDTGAVVQSAPAASGGLIYAGNWHGTVFALSAATGSPRWHVAGPGAIYGSPAVGDGAVYIGFPDQTYALDSASGRVRWTIGVSATYSTPVIVTPASPVAPRGGARYFAETGHNLGAPFLAFWQQYGGLQIFGYPLTEAFVEGGQTWQYFERFALVSAHGQVSTVPLGRQLTQGRHFPAPGAASSGSASRYFPATGYTVSGAFLRFWTLNHGDVLLGNPISPVITEGNGDGTGRRYPLQWFERGRLEYHPELAGTPYVVELGLLGRQALVKEGWLQ